MMSEPTNYIESNALLAVQSHDDDHAKELLRTMLPNELLELIHAADALGYLARRVRQNMVNVPIEESVGEQ